MAVLDPAALARPVPLPWGGEMPLGEFLERYPVEILVHTWDLVGGHGSGCLGRTWCLVRDALETAQQFAPCGPRGWLGRP